MCGSRGAQNIATGSGAKARADQQKAQQQAQLDAQLEMQRDAQRRIEQQNNLLVQQLQQQAQTLQAETAQRAAELRAAQAPATTVANNSPYATTTGQGTAGAAQEQTTAPARPRKPPNQTLQLSAEVSMPGVGINLGGY